MTFDLISKSEPYCRRNQILGIWEPVAEFLESSSLFVNDVPGFRSGNLQIRLVIGGQRTATPYTMISKAGRLRFRFFEARFFQYVYIKTPWKSHIISVWCMRVHGLNCYGQQIYVCLVFKYIIECRPSFVYVQYTR